MDAFINPNWHSMEMPIESFEQYLKNAGFDYKRDGWSNGIRYSMAHNGQEFAFADEKKKVIRFDPAILKK